MGLYDRPYYQDDHTRSPFASANRSVITNLIIVNAVIFVINAFLLKGSGYDLNEIFSVKSDTVVEPWNWWQFLTYGFMHSRKNAFHVIGNMLGLYFLGQEVERHYGSRTFLRMYLTALVFCSIVWGAIEWFSGRDGGSLIGASGAVTTVIMLFALNFPRRTILFMMFIPMPAWVLGVFIVISNLFAVQPSEAGAERVAFDVHLMGALYGYIFFKTRWAAGSWLDQVTQRGFPKFRLPRRKPKLKVHTPESNYQNLDAQADALLEKVHREGQQSLTPRERKILEDYSRRMKQKHS